MTEKELKLCDEKRREEFVKFISTGEASEEFLAHLDGCPICQTATDKVVEKQGEALHRAAEELRRREDMRKGQEKKKTVNWGIMLVNRMAAFVVFVMINAGCIYLLISAAISKDLPLAILFLIVSLINLYCFAYIFGFFKRRKKNK